jgi:hypothetical protein
MLATAHAYNQNGAISMFSRVSYRRGIIEGVIIFLCGRLGALITPAFFPDVFFVLVPLLCQILMYLLPPFWATRRIQSTKRERLSRRFWLLGPCLAALCLIVDSIIGLACGLQPGQFGIQRGPALLRMLTGGENGLTFTDFVFSELKTAALLFALYTLIVICTRLAGGGFLRFTMPAGGNRVTL